MKKTLLLLFAVYLCAAHALAQEKQKTEPHPTSNGVGWTRVDSPNGYESFTDGESVKVHWTSGPGLTRAIVGYAIGKKDLPDHFISLKSRATDSCTWVIAMPIQQKLPAELTIFVAAFANDSMVQGVSDQSDSPFTVYPEKKKDKRKKK